jgi:hypothetical protein
MSDTDTNDNAYQQRLAVLGIGLAGCSGHGTDGSTISYYDRRLRAYLGELVEGGWVIIKTQPLGSNPLLAVMAPLCRGSLAPGMRDVFQGVEGSIVAQAIAADTDNPAAPLARLMLAAPQLGIFDQVAPDLYAAWWLSHGARVGQRRGDKIVWADGTEEAIPPFDSRYQEGQP